jgi:CubicO group peptidase (beta-lactamase class C family)
MTMLRNYRYPEGFPAARRIQAPSCRRAGIELIVLGLTISLLTILLFVGMAYASTVASPAASSNASSYSCGPTDEKVLATFMDGVVSAQIIAYHIPGATVAVVKDGRIILCKGYGYADIDKRQKVVANQTLFRVGSVSKLFIWTAVMQLVEQGKLDLDADVNIYLKAFQIPATFAEPITLKSLISHTSGFEDLATGGRIFVHNASDIIAQEDYLKNMMPARVRPTGVVTAYSNYGSALAAYIVEQVSGMPFQEYVQENILLPLDMKNTTYKQPPQPNLAANMAKGYLYKDNAFSEEPFEFLQPWPTGSMSSTSEDMARFMIAHLQNGSYGERRIMEEATAQRMHSRLFSNDPKVSGMAYGFYEKELCNQSMILHGGDTILFHTQLVLLPERSLGLFVSYNSPSGDSEEQAGRDLLQAFMDHYYSNAASAGKLKSISGSGENLSRFAGSYRPDRSAFTTFEKAGTLFSQIKILNGPNETLAIARPGQAAKQWIEVEPLVFWPADGIGAQAPSERLVFGKDGKGEINYLFFENNPTTAYEKVVWYEEAGYSFGILAVCILLFLSTLIWPLRSISNRCLSKQEMSVNTERMARAARWLAGGAGMLNLLFLIGLLSIASASLIDEIIYSTPASFLAVLTIPLITAILTPACTAFCAWAWKNGYWNLTGRIHYTSVVLALLTFIWWLNNWNLLGYKL